jgi:hypothetical protein
LWQEYGTEFFIGMLADEDSGEVVGLNLKTYTVASLFPCLMQQITIWFAGNHSGVEV